MTVLDNESSNLTITLPASASEAAGVLTNAGLVRLAGTLPTNLVVSLRSSATNRLTVASTVTIAAGQFSNTFSLATINNSIHEGDQTILVTASAAGFSNGLASMLIVDDDLPPIILTQ